MKRTWQLKIYIFFVSYFMLSIRFLVESLGVLRGISFIGA